VSIACLRCRVTLVVTVCTCTLGPKRPNSMEGTPRSTASPNNATQTGQMAAQQGPQGQSECRRHRPQAAQAARLAHIHTCVHTHALAGACMHTSPSSLVSKAWCLVAPPPTASRPSNTRAEVSTQAAGAERSAQLSQPPGPTNHAGSLQARPSDACMTQHSRNNSHAHTPKRHPCRLDAPLQLNRSAATLTSRLVLCQDMCT
jgi:hypothetical protein